MDYRQKLAANTRIASALLDVLGSTGNIAGRVRALRTAGGEGGTLRNAGSWIDIAKLGEMFDSVPVDKAVARLVGQALVTPSGLSLALCYSGIATVEKAYRRVDHLFAREDWRSVYHTLALEDGRATIEYEAASGVEGLPIFCQVREGMLQALPLGFGLLPARVREIECVHRGDARCRYEVKWSRSSRRGVVIGAFLGGLAGLALALSVPPAALGIAFLGTNLWVTAGWGLFGATALGTLAGTAGHSVDLGRQLEAVAGARRGQLALLDQADGALAERMDELAKLDASLEAVAGPSSARSPGLAGVLAGRSAESVVDGGEDAERAADLAREIHGASGGVQSSFAELHRALVQREGWTQAELVEWIQAGARETQRIQAAAMQLLGDADESSVECEDGADAGLAAVVRRAAEGLRTELGDGQLLDMQIESDLPAIDFNAFQLEQVVVQLLRNALAATEGQGRVGVVLRATGEGIELLVEDDGVGMAEDAFDETFDPFSGGGVAGVDTEGVGLAICYRIVHEHAGELHVSTEEGVGTRVCVLLPVPAAR